MNKQVVGSLGFEPRIANAPGWYPKPIYAELTQDTQILLARRRPQQATQYEANIINTLLKATNEGKAKKTVQCFASSLKNINQHANIDDPESVKAYIASLQRNPQTKNRPALAYDWYCKTNGMQWKKPYYKWERKIPLIPTTENINKIISASTRKYATVFTILAETGLEAQELATMQRKSIDQERGIINAEGCKGHNSRSFKLKPQTAEMLRTYLRHYKQDTPFPTSHAMGEALRNTRRKLAKKLSQPELNNIPMRNLRHHFATMKYEQTKDILLVKQLLGHKKIETTMFYTQLITFNEEEEYSCKTATNAKEATDLVEHGFTYIATTPDGLMLFKKRK